LDGKASEIELNPNKNTISTANSDMSKLQELLEQMEVRVRVRVSVRVRVRVRENS